MKDIKLISGRVPSDHLRAMVKALRVAGLPVEVKRDGSADRVCSYASKHEGKIIFFAMRGRSDWLVRSADGLFNEGSHISDSEELFWFTDNNERGES